MCRFFVGDLAFSVWYKRRAGHRLFSRFAVFVSGLDRMSAFGARLSLPFAYIFHFMCVSVFSQYVVACMFVYGLGADASDAESFWGAHL